MIENEQASEQTAGEQRIRVRTLELQSCWKRCHKSSNLTSAFIDEKMEAHGVELLCPRSHSKLVAELGRECRLPNSQET